MNSPKQSQRFAEIEYCLQRYFDGQLAPVMGNVQQELSKKADQGIQRLYHQYQRNPAFGGQRYEWYAGRFHAVCQANR